MAYQDLRMDIGEFKLDLHDTEVREAINVVRRRIEECHRYGIRVLKVIYGTPDEFDRSIAKRVHELVRCHDLVVIEMLPSYVFSDREPTTLDPALRIFVRPNPSPQSVDENTSFTPFMPKFEKDVARKLRCSVPYMPLKRVFALNWSARAIGCSQEQLFALANTSAVAQLLDESGGFTWDALCLAAKKHRELSKTRMRSSVRISTKTDAQFAQAIDTAPALLDPVQVSLQQLEHARALARDSKYEDAERELLPLTTASRLPFHVIEDALLELGKVYIALNRAEAETVLRKSLDLRTQRLGKGPHLRAGTAVLSQFYLLAGDYDAFFRLINNTDVDAESQPDLSDLLLYALIEFSSGKFEESIATLRAFSELKGDTPISPSLDAYRYDLLGMNFTARYELFLAQLAFKCAWQSCESEPKACENVRPRIRMHQGIVFRRAGRYREAALAFTESTNLMKRQARSRSILFADVMSSMAVVQKNLANLIAAEECLVEAAAIYKEQGRLDTPEYAKILNNYAALRIAQRKYAEAEIFLNQAHDILQLKAENQSDVLVTIQMHRGNLHLSKGELDLAHIVLEDALRLAKAELGTNSPRAAKAKIALADCLTIEGDSKGATAYYAEAVETLKSFVGSNSPYIKGLEKKLDLIRNSGIPAFHNDQISADLEMGKEPNALDVVASDALLQATRKIIFGRRIGPASRAFALAAGGNIEASIEDFEEAEDGGEIDASAYRDYSMVMFIHGRIGRSYAYAKQALALSPGIELHPAIGTILLEFPDAFDKFGSVSQSAISRFTQLRVEYLRPKL